MREQEAVTQTVTASEAQEGWSDLLDRVYRGGTRVIVEKSGIPVAAVISPRELERFRVLEAERQEEFKVIDEIRARNAGADPDEVYAEVTKIVEAVRQEAYDRKHAAKGGR
jgi:prevent-host-death family protein